MEVKTATGSLGALQSSTLWEVILSAWVIDYQEEIRKLQLSEGKEEYVRNADLPGHLLVFLFLPNPSFSFYIPERGFCLVL